MTNVECRTRRRKCLEMKTPPFIASLSWLWHHHSPIRGESRSSSLAAHKLVIRWRYYRVSASTSSGMTNSKTSCPQVVVTLFTQRRSTVIDTPAMVLFQVIQTFIYGWHSVSCRSMPRTSMINSPLIIVAYIHLSFVVFIIAQTNYVRRFRD